MARDFAKLQSTLPAKGATLSCFHDCLLLLPTSIHAPSEGSDAIAVVPLPIQLYFNPRSQRRERRFLLVNWFFLLMYFNPRSQRRERQTTIIQIGNNAETSIHAPSEGSDSKLYKLLTSILKLQSTLPAKGATKKIEYIRYLLKTSIHAPSEGSDLVNTSKKAVLKHFNPRSQRRERRFELHAQGLTDELQSTLPAKGATARYSSN